MPSPEVMVVGTVAQDTVAHVDRLPGPDETVRVRNRVERPGGAAGNVAMALGRWGMRPTLLSVVGPDFAGSTYRQELISAGVDVAHLIVSDAPTSHVYLFTASDGRQQIFSDPGSAAAMEALVVPPLPSDGPTLAHFAAGDLASYPKLMAGLDTVTFDPGQEVFQRPVDEALACLPHVDVLLLNEHEHRRIEEATDTAPSDAAGTENYPEAVVVSRGADGCTMHTAAGETSIPAVPADVRDPTGAGDAHRAGVVFGLGHGLDIGLSARIGAVAAAFVVESQGAQAGLPSRDELNERFEANWGAWPL